MKKRQETRQPEKPFAEKKQTVREMKGERQAVCVRACVVLCVVHV